MYMQQNVKTKSYTSQNNSSMKSSIDEVEKVRFEYSRKLESVNSIT